MSKHLIHALLAGIALLPAQTASAQLVPRPGHAAAMAASAPRDPLLKPVFEDFGGKPGLVVLMDDFMADIMADPRISHFFADVDRARIKVELVDQFCVILDGPCTYTGKDMTSIHDGLDIDRADFNALVEDLQKAMDKHGIPFHSQNKLLAKLAAMHGAVITK